MRIDSNFTSGEWDKRNPSAILYYGQPPVIEEKLRIVCADGEVRWGVCLKIVCSSPRTKGNGSTKESSSTKSVGAKSPKSWDIRTRLRFIWKMR